MPELTIDNPEANTSGDPFPPKGTGRLILNMKDVCVPDVLGAKLLKAIDISGNEFAMGYDDSSCTWHFYYGSRGAGHMMDNWPHFTSEIVEVGEALEEYIKFMENNDA